MAILGMILMIGGFCAAVIFNIRILIHNFKENIGWGLASLFLGIPMIIYVAMRWDVAGKDFLKMLGSMAVAVIAMFIAGAGAASGM